MYHAYMYVHVNDSCAWQMILIRTVSGRLMILLMMKSFKVQSSDQIPGGNLEEMCTRFLILTICFSECYWIVGSHTVCTFVHVRSLIFETELSTHVRKEYPYM